jgi:ABC-type nickel/cobalt efflux system permease component RcnA
MPDWLAMFLSGLQRSTVNGLATELRAGGIFTAVLAFALGALHALTPGHGKSALTAYFLGQEARLGTGIRVALAASLLHVAMGDLAFIVLRFVVSQTPLMTGRGSPFFLVTGYGLILVAGIVMLVQSLRPASTAAHPHVLTLGVGLLPCPLTISVLGFAWAQASGPSVMIVLMALAAGIAFTIGVVAVLAILLRRYAGHALAHRISGFALWGRRLQAMAGAAIIVIAIYSLWTSVWPGPAVKPFAQSSNMRY